jgi:methyl-accepting chemotaxis protein
MFSNRGLKFKVVFAFTFIALFGVATGFISWWSIHKTIRIYSTLNSEIIPRSSLSDKMRFSFTAATQHLSSAAFATEAELKKGFVAKTKESKTAFAVALKEYSQRTMPADERAHLNKISPFWEGFTAKIDAALEQIEKNEDAGKVFVNSELPRLNADFVVLFNPLFEVLERESLSVTVRAYKAANLGTTLNLLSIAVTFLVSLMAGFLLSSSLSKRLVDVSKQVSIASDETSIVSAQIASSSKQLSQGASEAAASLEETVASLEELSSTVKLNSDRALEANQLSKVSKEAAESGDSEISQLTDAMDKIASGSKQIEEIIAVIDDIAFQTNLLALNAAVEAARAGEQGKGFAVVAEAVRNLAHRSAIAAKDISALIRDNVERTQSGAKIVSKSGVALKQIVESVKKVADLNQEISAASQEQSSGLTQISTAMNQLDLSTQSNAASSEQVEAAAEQLLGQASTLNSTVLSLNKLIHGSSWSATANVDSPFSNKKAGQKKVDIHWAPVEKFESNIKTANTKDGKNNIVHFSKKISSTKAQNAIPFDEDQDTLALADSDKLRRPATSKEPKRKIGNTDGF